jgi:hypothetical protein
MHFLLRELSPLWYVLELYGLNRLFIIGIYLKLYKIVMVDFYLVILYPITSITLESLSKPLEIELNTGSPSMSQTSSVAMVIQWVYSLQEEVPTEHVVPKEIAVQNHG